MIFRSAKKLKNSLAPSNFNKNSKRQPAKSNPYPSKLGSYKCRHERCKCCNNIAHNVKYVRSNNTGESFPLTTRLDCNSSYVVYMLECSCGLQYIGRTIQTLRARINKHRFNVTNVFFLHSVSTHALSKHGWDFNQFTVTPIQEVSASIQNRTKTLARREMYWIYKWNTLNPYGLNEALENIYWFYL